MKFLFKISVIVNLLLVCDYYKSSAQSGPVVCKVAYDYDLAGNRVKREYRCAATWMPWDPMPVQGHVIFTTIFPNPTPGGLTGVFSESIGGNSGPAHITVSTMGGIVVFQQSYNYVTTTISLDISQQIPGQYLLTASAFNTVETYVITKL